MEPYLKCHFGYVGSFNAFSPLVAALTCYGYLQQPLQRTLLWKKSRLAVLLTQARSSVPPCHHWPCMPFNHSICCCLQCKAAVQTARKQVADMIGAEPDEIFFTSSGTESDHWAIWGARACRQRAPGGRQIPHIVTSAIEHPAVLQYLDSLQQEVRCRACCMCTTCCGAVACHLICPAKQANSLQTDELIPLPTLPPLPPCTNNPLFESKWAKPTSLFAQNHQRHALQHVVQLPVPPQTASLPHTTQGCMPNTILMHTVSSGSDLLHICRRQHPRHRGRCTH